MAGRSFALAAAILAASPAVVVHAQDINEGRNPPQLFAAVCATCHQSPRGLGRQIGGGALVNFLRQHYTTSREQAALLASYVHSFANEPAAGAPRSGAPRGQGARQDGDEQGTRRRPANPEAGRPPAGQATTPATRQPRAPDGRPAARARPPAETAVQTEQPVAPGPQASPGGEPQPGDESTSAIPAGAPASTARTDDIAD